MYCLSATFLLLLTISAVLQTGESCSCLPAHPQEHFCKSDFVILATVKRIFEREHSRIYKVRIRQQFKMSEKAHVALKHGRLHTAKYDSLCGVELGVKKTYVITGRINGLQAHINLCGYSELWSQVSHRQRKGFKLLYNVGCECKTMICRSAACVSRNNSCAWNMNSVCQTKHGICLKNAKGHCQWTQSLALKKCLNVKPRKTETTTTAVTPVYQVPDPFRLPQRPKEYHEEPVRTEPNRYQRAGYYHYNKISN